MNVDSQSRGPWKQQSRRSSSCRSYKYLNQLVAQSGSLPLSTENQRAEMTGNDLYLGYDDNSMAQSILWVMTRISEVHGSNNNAVPVHADPTKTSIGWLLSRNPYHGTPKIKELRWRVMTLHWVMAITQWYRASWEWGLTIPTSMEATIITLQYILVLQKPESCGLLHRVPQH